MKYLCLPGVLLISALLLLPELSFGLPLIFSFQPTVGNADGLVSDVGAPMTGPFVFLAGLQSAPHTPGDVRGVVEFDTSTIMGQSGIVHATLSLTEYATEPDTFNLYGYEGNGIVDQSDFSQTTNLIGSGSTQLASAVGRTLTFDVTSFVQAYPVVHVGFLITDPSLNSVTSNGSCCGFARFVSFDDLGAPFPEAAFITSANLPTLTVEVVPLPAAIWLFWSGLVGILGWKWKRLSCTDSSP